MKKLNDEIEIICRNVWCIAVQLSYMCYINIKSPHKEPIKMFNLDKFPLKYVHGFEKMAKTKKN